MVLVVLAGIGGTLAAQPPVSPSDAR